MLLNQLRFEGIFTVTLGVFSSISLLLRGAFLTSSIAGDEPVLEAFSLMPGCSGRLRIEQLFSTVSFSSTCGKNAEIGFGFGPSATSAARALSFFSSHNYFRCCWVNISKQALTVRTVSPGRYAVATSFYLLCPVCGRLFTFSN